MGADFAFDAKPSTSSATTTPMILRSQRLFGV
jgi:hypothetical protein